MAACLAGYSEKLRTWERGVSLLRGCSVQSDLVLVHGSQAQVWKQILSMLPH